MSPASPGRDDGEVEAILVDRYLESLLARRPAPTEGLDPGLTDAARQLGRALPRFHPSFRFEERLAARLATAARDVQLPMAAGAEGVVVPFQGGRSRTDAHGPGASGDEPLDDRRPGPHPVVVGGVLTSAAVTIAGAAYVAWRRRRPGDPMTRAIRAVARTRLS